ncbi:VOC family protein [Acidovorax sp. SUPP1855]|uniref:VOC family protein n=1 Tax=unclassified Acidovorax TaxID=2684926 RepID=UPI0023DE4516|nr:MULTISPECIES: VOC family protein [unclassified Acidovorax]GKS86175.1 VOC family protein [Acidovorax sp. SUPP1855]GKS92493.1 VOC family protein [Acidovorax sp. SUPP2539]GKT01687.1 VOC family protein [Acidovorax sp. SUPP3434]
MNLPDACIDHLVVMADRLDSGVDWCRRTLGVVPAMGGEHPLMGTHNRLLNLSGPAHPRTYLEIIAMNPGAPGPAAGTRRWFDMDDPALQARVARDGPQLIHWVASVRDVAAAHAALAARGLDRGEVATASRPTPLGLLQWQITLRPDGQRLLGGCLPTLIQWGERHPCYSLPAASGVQLQSLRLEHPEAPALASACATLGLGTQVTVSPGAAPRLQAVLATPRGPVTLASKEPV